MYTYQTTIRMHDTDAAGLLFFGNQFKIAHDAFESLMEAIHFSLAHLLRETDFLLPIVHAEADYKAPLFVGDTIHVTVLLGAISRHSFTLLYDFTDKEGKIVGRVKTVHVAINKEHGTKIEVPCELKDSLTAFFSG